MSLEMSQPHTVKVAKPFYTKMFNLSHISCIKHFVSILSAIYRIS